MSKKRVKRKLKESDCFIYDSSEKGTAFLVNEGKELWSALHTFSNYIK